jgi:hypothetical protein
MEYNKFEIDNEELKRVIDEYAPKGKVRSYDELYNDARKKMDAALTHYIVKKFGEDKKEFVLSNNDVTRDNQTDSADIKDKGDKVPREVLMTILFEFAFIFGNYSDKRAWIRVDARTFIKFPYLIENKGHSVFVMLFARHISVKLRDIDNAFLTILKKNKVNVNKDKRQFCFSKGHLLVLEKDRLDVIADLKIIFEQLNKKNVNERVWTGLKWFTS